MAKISSTEVSNKDAQSATEVALLKKQGVPSAAIYWPPVRKVTA